MTFDNNAMSVIIAFPIWKKKNVSGLDVSGDMTIAVIGGCRGGKKTRPGLIYDPPGIS